SAGGVPRLIFRHAVQITVRGSYLELLNYLAALEKLPTQMLWGEVKFAVERHPDAVLTVTLSTLSMDKTWLSV
ncbi:MAG TPA: agglutinin biogenesis protein, partial [Gallionella sp.]|nr:agglutinin biogenesis protein [Gallionella sp.]